MPPYSPFNLRGDFGEETSPGCRHRPDLKQPYFLRPTDLFFSRRSDAWHFLHLVAARAFREPHFRQTFRNRRFFCAICFLVTSAMGNYDVRPSLFRLAPTSLRTFRAPADEIATDNINP